MNRKLVFDKALALRDEGKYREAADLFLDLAKDTDNLFEKAGMLLNTTHALKGSGRFDLAKNQLDLVRESRQAYGGGSNAPARPSALGPKPSITED